MSLMKAQHNHRYSKRNLVSAEGSADKKLTKNLSDHRAKLIAGVSVNFGRIPNDVRTGQPSVGSVCFFFIYLNL